MHQREGTLSTAEQCQRYAHVKHVAVQCEIFIRGCSIRIVTIPSIILPQNQFCSYMHATDPTSTLFTLGSRVLIARECQTRTKQKRKPYTLNQIGIMVHRDALFSTINTSPQIPFHLGWQTTDAQGPWTKVGSRCCCRELQLNVCFLLHPTFRDFPVGSGRFAFRPFGWVWGGWLPGKRPKLSGCSLRLSNRITGLSQT